MHAISRISRTASSRAARQCRAFTTSVSNARERSSSKRKSSNPNHFKDGASRLNNATNIKDSSTPRTLDDLDSRSKETVKVNAKTSKTYEIFRKLALSRYNALIAGQESWGQKKEAYMSFGLQSKWDFDREAKLFRMAISKACDIANERNGVTRESNPLFFNLRRAFVEGDLEGLGREITFSFHNFLMRSRFPPSIAATHKKIADFRFPYEWFPATRALQRTVHLHVGPTNSGKTYNALKALENARSGIYAGPLRLLAHEIYSRFKAKGKKCALVTGEELRIPEGEDNYYRSCTVEMTPLNLLVDVAVIDEIQMIGDYERGWAWTQAFLGVQAREVHLCGEERSVDLIKSLCNTIGDKCIVHNYQRLSPLQTMDKSLRGKFSNLQKGDAVVTFSRLSIHSLKASIEKATGKRVAIVYGGLPPETRAQQAALFNDPDNDYDYLVASDAIGMGLNLEIKRIVFEQTSKRTSTNYRQMTVSEIKQIGGRAGRYRTASQAIRSGNNTEAAAGGEEIEPPKQVGLVTTLDEDDLHVVQSGFLRDPPAIPTAGIQAPPSVIERFSTYFPPNTPFSYILARLRDLARVNPRFHLCSPKEVLQVADLIQPYPMSVYDRCVFLNAPVFLREKNGKAVLQAVARCVSTMQGGHILDIPEIEVEMLEATSKDYSKDRNEYLRGLESLHKAITLYLWLSYRYSGVFTSQNLAFHIKSLCEAKIDAHLGEFHLSESQRKANADRSRARAREAERQRIEVLGKEAEALDQQQGEGSQWESSPNQHSLVDEVSELPKIQRLEDHPAKNQPNNS